MVQSILEKLADENVQSFDFGRIPPSTHATDGIYFFKKSIKGLNTQYNGEWTYYKIKMLEYLMHFAKKFIAKRQRY